MAGRGPAPKTVRRNKSDKPIRGEWTAVPGIGWQHGPVPPVPDGLMPATIAAWEMWMRSWIAAHWTPTDLAGLRQLIRLYDQVERGEFQRMTELRMLMDTYGITPKGQQDRRWTPPKPTEQQEPAPDESVADSPYARLRAV